MNSAPFLAFLLLLGACAQTPPVSVPEAVPVPEADSQDSGFTEEGFAVVETTLRQGLIQQGREDWTVYLLDEASLKDLLGDQNYEEFSISFLMNVFHKHPPFASAVGNLLRKNKEAQRFTLPEGLHPHLKMLSLEDKESCFDEARKLKTGGWKLFNDDHPYTAGVHIISRPGISRDKTVAVIYLGIHNNQRLNSGGLRILIKEGDAWTLRPEIFWPDRM